MPRKSQDTVKAHFSGFPLIISSRGDQTMPHWNFMRATLLSLVLTVGAQAAVKVLFDRTSLDVGPFPSDALTVPDSAQKTGVRVHLPQADCEPEPSTCEEIAMIN